MGTEGVVGGLGRVGASEDVLGAPFRRHQFRHCSGRQVEDDQASNSRRVDRVDSLIATKLMAALEQHTIVAVRLRPSRELKQAAAQSQRARVEVEDAGPEGCAQTIPRGQGGQTTVVLALAAAPEGWANNRARKLPEMNRVAEERTWAFLEAPPEGVQATSCTLNQSSNRENRAEGAALLRRVGGSSTASATCWGTPWAEVSHAGCTCRCTSRNAVTRGHEDEPHPDRGEGRSSGRGVAPPGEGLGDGLITPSGLRHPPLLQIHPRPPAHLPELP